jgi:hypothetical protein
MELRTDMTARWLVAKYIPDLRRREPMNVGVILVMPDGSAHGRFRAMRDDGGLDGRSARWARSTDNYRAHVDYWRYIAEQGFADGAQLERAVMPLGDESYFLDLGGERLSGAQEAIDPDAFLDRLYAELVEGETPDRTSLSVTELAEQTLGQLHLPHDAVIQRDFRIESVMGDGATDAVIFDYRFDNGAVHLIRNVPLSFADQRSWDAVHATLWSFDQAATHDLHQAQNYIGFVKPREADSELSGQIDVLRSKATVIDVSEPELAAGELAEIFSFRN